MSMFIDAIFPRFCIVCKSEGSLFCADCTTSHRASLAEKMNVDSFPSSLDSMTALFSYGDPTVRLLIHHWKFVYDTSTNEIINDWVFDGLKRQKPQWSVDAVTFIPLHTSRLAFRGFNQAELLAEMLASHLQKPVQPLLERSQKTAAQSQQSSDTRHVSSLEGCFSPLQQTKPIPTSVLLCDDVFTSGATLHAAAIVLRKIGIKTIHGFTFARGGKAS